jgi:hypothetical protein
MQLGDSTVIDAITLADRYANAERRSIAAQAHYATALARVRFETGALAPTGPSKEATLEEGDLTSLPWAGSATPRTE